MSIEVYHDLKVVHLLRKQRCYLEAMCNMIRAVVVENIETRHSDYLLGV